MYKFFKQNKNVFLIAIALFVVSLTVLLFFLTEQLKTGHGLDASVMNASETSHELNSEEDYRKQIGSSEDPFIVVGLDGNTKFVSSGFEELSGYKPEEIKDKSLYTLVHPSDLASLTSSIGKVYESQQPITIIGPFRLMTAIENQYHVFIGSLFPMSSEEKVSGVAITLRDITKDLPEESDEIKTELETDKQVGPSLEEKLKEHSEFLQLYNEFKNDVIQSEQKTETINIEQPAEQPASVEQPAVTTETQDTPEPATIAEPAVFEAVASEPAAPEIQQEQLTKETEKKDPEFKDMEKSDKDTKDTKEKKIRDEKNDTDSKLVAQSIALDRYQFIYPIWPYLVR